MLNGWTVEMIGPQQQLSGSLIILELLKIYKSLLWKFVHLHRGVLGRVFPISHATIRNLVTKFRPKTR